MKKLIIFIFLVILLCCTNLTLIKNFNLAEIFPEAQVEVFINNEISFTENNYVNNGNGKIVFISINELHSFLNNNEVMGYTLKIKNLTLNEVFKRLQIKNVECVQGAYYGVSGLFTKKINYDKNYNFECAELNGEIHIGTPILLGSY